MKKYMVVERYKEGSFDKVYARFEEKGRMLPPGLHYLNSWLNKEKSVCFHKLVTNDLSLFTEWIKNWEGLVDFEIVGID